MIILSVMVIITMEFSSANITNSSDVNLQSIHSLNPSISVNTDGFIYEPGDPIIIQGRVLDENGTPGSYRILIVAKNISQDKIEYKISTFTSEDGYFVDTGLITKNEGDYTITASTTIHETYQEAITTIKIHKNIWYSSPSGIMVFIGLANFAALVVLLSSQKIIKNNYTVFEMLRFIFISSITFSIIVTFVLVETQIGTASPMGLVTKTALDERGIIIDREWVLNIGGDPLNRYADGLQIPIKIIVFGVAGGYLRFLYKTAKNWNMHVQKDNTDDNMVNPLTKEKLNEQTLLFYKSFEDLILFILAPLLAVAVWLLLLEIEINSVYTITIASFTAGLVTYEIIQTMLRFTQSILDSFNGKLYAKK